MLQLGEFLDYGTAVGRSAKKTSTTKGTTPDNSLTVSVCLDPFFTYQRLALFTAKYFFPRRPLTQKLLTVNIVKGVLRDLYMNYSPIHAHIEDCPRIPTSF
jgi:hypothetical protein